MMVLPWSAWALPLRTTRLYVLILRGIISEPSLRMLRTWPSVCATVTARIDLLAASSRTIFASLMVPDGHWLEMQGILRIHARLKGLRTHFMAPNYSWTRLIPA